MKLRKARKKKIRTARKKINTRKAFKKRHIRSKGTKARMHVRHVCK